MNNERIRCLGGAALAAHPALLPARGPSNWPRRASSALLHSGFIDLCRQHRSAEHIWEFNHRHPQKVDCRRKSLGPLDRSGRRRHYPTAITPAPRRFFATDMIAYGPSNYGL